MKLLIVTQEVDTAGPLGFFVRWIEGFSKHSRQVTVICLREGHHALPAHVRVYSLGKERGAPRTAPRIRYALRFMRLVWRLRKEYDTVFVHMNPEYVLLAGAFWRLTGRRIGLWYVHKSVTTTLRIAARIVHHIFTVSIESFRLPSQKVRVMGHGIDASLFLPHTPRTDALRILTTGRISPTKDILGMLAVTDMLHVYGTPFTFRIVGAPGSDTDREYENRVRSTIAEKPYASQVDYVGSVPHIEIPRLLANADIYLNLSKTGSADKGVLEALCAGVPVVTNNPGLAPLIPEAFFVASDDPLVLMQRIALAQTVDMNVVAATTRAAHDLSSLIARICTKLAA